MRFIHVAFISLSFLCIFGCSNRTGKNFEVSDFSPITNIAANKENNIAVRLDYDSAILNGFVIPSKKDIDEGVFAFDFKIKNTSQTSQIFYYKIYYQNETYKFPEGTPYDNENFYGTWENPDLTFLVTDEIPNDNQFHTVKGSFRIIGNPRNEKKYFGSDAFFSITDEELNLKIEEIKKSKEWIRSLEEKAKVNNISFEKQLNDDAAYIIHAEQEKKVSNQRWKRNPRVGNYSFLLVVSDRENITNGKIPNFVQNISIQENGNYVNPYTYFLLGDITKNENIFAVKAKEELKVFSKIEFSKGVYAIDKNYENQNMDRTFFDENCGNSEELFLKAQLQQFIHQIDKSHTFENIPVVANVAGGDYSQKDYSSNNKYAPNQLIKVPIKVTECPCKTVHLDSTKKKVLLVNPGTKEGEWRKENVGIKTRHGLTYGKYWVKIKMPQLLNKNNVWNGLTNAIWMINQENATWNNRRKCDKEGGGYIPKNANGKDADRVKENSYSEIDIEIVKALRNWPASSYVRGKKREDAPLSDSDKVMVTYTNWDLACRQPEKYVVGVESIEYKDNSFEIHRWDDWYKALTGKYPVSDVELFKGPFYWFEIEWNPTEIIWRLGPEKDKMRILGYMNDKVTSIPNNQMLFIITQEWHLSNWWPEAPFDQNRIPFPQKDLIGEIYEIEIE